MSGEEVELFYDRVKSFHDAEDFKSVIPELDSSSLIPKLREYQVDAVKWMLYKEYQLDVDKLPRQYDGMELNYPKGGILADEMGLGKTVEMISLILNNPCNDPHCSQPDVFLDFEESEDSREGGGGSTPIAVEVEAGAGNMEVVPAVEVSEGRRGGKSLRKRQVVSYAGMDADPDLEPPKKRRKKQEDQQPQTAEGKGKAGALYQHLKRWYEQALDEVKRFSRHQDYSQDNLTCSCSTYVDSEEVTCARCKSVQHATCVGLRSGEVTRRYFCPRCLAHIKPYKSRATFIVSPDSIVHQWMDEIKRHVKGERLKVHFYTGVKGSRYIQPSELADNDIVMTTYSVLRSDLDYCVEDSGRTLRFQKRFHTFPPPLLAIHWWRICLDEAQMVEGANTKPGLMARELSATHRWAVTGTPIQKTINDLYGLMQFLMLEPLSEVGVWNRLMGEPDALQDLLKHVMWRSRKLHVYDMLGVPRQTVLTHWLSFSPVEAHFYQRTHTDCTNQFQTKLSRFDDLDVPLVSLDRGFVSKMLGPLLSLRQACIHPQAVRGKFLKYKRTMTMEELLSDMVTQARQDVDVCIRAMVASLNGQAGLNILLGEIPAAIALYRQVLQLPARYPTDIIKVDKLQKLHTLHNLADVIREFGVSEPTLHDDTLAQDAEDLARNYIQKYDTLVESSKSRVAAQRKCVATLSQGRPLGFSTWWEEVITQCDDPKHLVSRIRSSVLDQQTKFPIKCTYSNKIKNIDSLYAELALWLAETDDARRDVNKGLDGLSKRDPITLSHEAIACHLRQGQPNDKVKRSKCKLCTFETSLLAYESRIFAIMKTDQEGRKKNKYVRSDDEDIGEGTSGEGEGKGKEIEHLEKASVHATKKEGNWKPGQMERILRELHSFAKSKKWSLTVTQDGQKHLSLLEAVRKEFLSLRTLWRHISDRVAAYDELSMAKMRFRLPLPDEVKLIQKKKLRETYIIQQHEICGQMERQVNERIVEEREVSKNIGVLMYLLNLQKNPNSDRDPCPICQEPLSDKWSVLECGHCFCFECMPNMLGSGSWVQVDCAVCRRKTPRAGVAYVDVTPRAPGAAGADGDSLPPVRGSHSTKVEAVVARALQVTASEPAAKILVFSTWEKVLDVIGEAFDINDIPFRRLSQNKKRSKQSLADFKVCEEVVGLLMPLRLGAKGLNLVEATHVFLVEPILNPADELQAVGRVHRIGQTKKTYVHRFVIQDTIEEKMLSALSSKEEWSSDKVTLQQLFNLFSRSANLTTHSDQPTTS